MCTTPPMEFNTNTFETYRHCDHALKICMWLGYTLRLIFVTFFCNLNFVIFRTFSHLESEVEVWGIVFHKHIF